MEIIKKKMRKIKDVLFSRGNSNEVEVAYINREEALKKINNGKASGLDGILDESYKCLGEDGV